jgi:hypothetical protein
MATETVPKAPAERTKEIPKSAPANRVFTPEYLAEQEAIMARVMEEGEKRIHRSVARAIAMGIIDKDGNLLKKELPPDMLRGADRDFGG